MLLENQALENVNSPFQKICANGTKIAKPEFCGVCLSVDLLILDHQN